MTPEQIERVFGRGRLKMATGAHVEVFREAVLPGERRRYTKRFLVTDEADFGAWTEREWRILARLIGHGILCVPDVVQFDAGAMGGMRRVQTYDAGITVDQWATLLPVARDGVVLGSVFDDCAHWWALAHHCLAALNEIHALQLVHLDVKGDNICIPYGPPHFDHRMRDTSLYAVFARLALIDFAFSLVSGERLAMALPIGWQKDYDYQSPRLLAALDAGRRGDLRPTQELDWRCDLYSLAAMLKRYLPEPDEVRAERHDTGWTASRYDDAQALIHRLRECHDRELPVVRPHQELMDITGTRVREPDLACSLTRGWSLARDAWVVRESMPITPVTRIVPPSQAVHIEGEIARIVPPTATTAVIRRPRARRPMPATAVIRRPRARLPDAPPLVHTSPPPATRTQKRWRAAGLVSVIGAAAALAAPSFIGDPDHPLSDRLQQTLAAYTRAAPGNVRSFTASSSPQSTSQPSDSSQPGTPPSLSPTPAAAPATNKLAEAEPTAETPSLARSTSTSPHSAHPATPAQAARSTPAPASPIRAPSPAKASRAAVARLAPHRSTPAVVASNPAKLAHPIASGTHMEIASASRPVDAGPPPASQAKTAPQTRVESEARTASANPAFVQSGVQNAPALPPARTEAAPIRSTASSANAAVTTQPAPAIAARRERPAANAPLPQPLAQLLKMFAPPQKAVPVEEHSVGSRKPIEPTVRPAQPSEPIQVADAAPAKQVPAQTNATIVTSPAPQVVASPMNTATSPTASADLVPLESRAPITDAHRTENAEDELAMRGRRLVAQVVPRLAASAYADLLPALSVVSVQSDPKQNREVINALYATWPSERSFIPFASVVAPRAKRLHQEAYDGYAHGRKVDDVLEIELEAFAANPRDPDIAAFLAFLHLHAKPAQPETARQLALHAIAMSGPQRTRRIDDWTTLAVASALSGRPDDARRFLFIQVALAADVDRSCRAALHAYADYGEPLRVPVQAMLYRVHSSPLANEYPSCTQHLASLPGIP